MAKKYTLAELQEMSNRFLATLKNNADRIELLRSQQQQLKDDIETALVNGNDRAYNSGLDKLARNQTEVKILEDFNANAKKRGGGKMFTDEDVRAAWELDRDHYRNASLKHIQRYNQLIADAIIEAEALGKLKEEANAKRDQYLGLMINQDRVPALGSDICVKNQINIVFASNSEEQKAHVLSAVSPLL